MMRWWLFMLAGCGRIAFDAGADGGGSAMCVGHDEDGDGVADACDLCPYVSESAAVDGDGDGVGDACDPDPVTPTESLAVFDPFIGDTPGWSYVGAPHDYADDSLVVNTIGDYAVIMRDAVVTNELVRVESEITQLNPTGAGQVTISFFEVGKRHYYCELYGDSASAKISLTYTFDDITYTAVASMPIAGLVPGATYLVADHRAGMVYCETSGGSVRAPIPTGFSAIERVAIQGTGVDLRLHYFAQVHSN
jgi:hypothetical protein